MDALKRLNDLFAEGIEAYLGDSGGKPFVVWMNKLNSFEVEEARRDAAVRRAERMAELAEDSAEVRGARTEMSLWSDEDLRRAVVNGQDQEIMLLAFDNLRTEEDWAELEDYVERAPTLLADDSVQPGDPRFETLSTKTAEYTTRLQAEITRISEERIAELAEVPRKKLEAKFIEDWRQRRTIDEWTAARRMTELWLSARQCEAVMLTQSLAGERLWDHSACDHSARFFGERGHITKVPDQALQRMVIAYESLQMRPRDAGNLDAPASSSGSSEQSKPAEDQSSPSTQDETPLAVPTT